MVWLSVTVSACITYLLTYLNEKSSKPYAGTRPAAQRTRTLFFHLLGGCRYLSMPSVSPGSSRIPKTVSSSAWIAYRWNIDGQKAAGIGGLGQAAERRRGLSPSCRRRGGLASLTPL